MAVTALITAAIAVGIATAIPTKDGSGRLPALGWNSWNEYECNINEDVFVQVGELMNSLGLKAKGYTYVNIDDCWSDKANPRNNATHEINVDLTKFPKGISHTAAKIHDLGLKIGIYGDAGTKTCGGFEGSLGYEDVDAATWAKWGVDYLKYDNCNVPLNSSWTDQYRWWPELWYGGPPKENQSEGDPSYTSGKPAPPGYDWSTSTTAYRYDRMKQALSKQSRTIQYSLCAWGHQHVEQWGKDKGQSWRMWGDIYPIWSLKYMWSWGLTPIINHASFFTHATDFYGHSDYDMLEVGNGNLTIEENRSHFAMWAALKSPLIIGTPLDGIKPEILNILGNQDLLDFNQDPKWGISAIPYKWGTNPDFTWNQTHPAEFYVGPSAKGLHVFMLNTQNTTATKRAVFGEIPGLEAHKQYRARDMWTGKDLGVFRDAVPIKLQRHDTAALRINEVDGKHPAPNFKTPRNWGKQEKPSWPRPGQKPRWW